MRHLTIACSLGLALSLALAGGALAQASGGADAKGNAPLKRPHTVNDGSAKRGASSFTEGQARQHIEHAGFSGVSNLALGDDGAWRGQAMRRGSTISVAMDFKGNVSTSGPATSSTTRATSTHAAATASIAKSRTTAMAAAEPARSESSAGIMSESRRSALRRRRQTLHKAQLHHHLKHTACVNPGVIGVACSGIDQNGNGVSDREDRAIRAGAKP